MTLLQIQDLFDTDEKCREALTKLRWPNGVECPRCHSTRIAWIKANKQFDCAECEYHFSVTSGTILNDTHLPLKVWFTAALLLCEAKKGMSAHQLKRTLWGNHKGSYKTAWYLCHRIRRAMREVERPMLDGTVEIDETYLGGRKHSQRKAGFGDSNKEIVIGIRQRGGALRFFHAEDARTGTLEKYIRENVSEDVDVIITDEYGPYRKAVGKARHETVKHRAGEYVRLGTDIHTNTAESAFSLLKRGLIGTWHRLSAKHLQAYLDEMTFRFDRRNREDLFIDTLRHIVTADPMTFEELTRRPEPHGFVRQNLVGHGCV